MEAELIGRLGRKTVDIPGLNRSLRPLQVLTHQK